jgi:hypothetical protein
LLQLLQPVLLVGWPVLLLLLLLHSHLLLVLWTAGCLQQSA